MDEIPQTMYQTDFQALTITRRSNPAPLRIKPKARSTHRPVQMDLEILQPFKPEVNVPFNLLVHKKPILHTHPESQIPEVKLEDKLFEQKLEARHKRSAVYMVPQISLDKIPDDVMYGKDGKNGLVSSIYSSDWKKAVDIAVKNSPFPLRENPLTRRFTKADMVRKSFNTTRFQSKINVPPMEIGLEKHLAAWEKENPIEFVDTTKLFWENYKETTNNCSSCECKDTLRGFTDEEIAELDSCLKAHEFRSPYTLHPPGYTGYVPRLAAGIPFRKKKFSKYDPFVTTTMTWQYEYDRDAI